MTNEEYIYRWLRDHGYTHVGTCAIMGSMQSESAFIPNNAQDGYGKDDAAYTASVDNGKLSAYEFAHDKIGYGLCQWTLSSRKAALLSYAVKTHRSIGDMEMQLEFLDKEMNEDFPGVRNLCKGTGTLDACSYSMVRWFENPAGQTGQNGRINVDLKNSIAMLNKYSGYAVETEDKAAEDSCDDEQLRTADVDYGDLPMTSVKSHTPIYVKLMQALMYLHGYAVEKTGEFDGATAECLRAWQEDHGLTVDAVCGPKTWQSLIEEEDV